MALPGHAVAYLIEHRPRRDERHGPSELLRDARGILDEPHRLERAGDGRAPCRVPRAQIVDQAEHRLGSSGRRARLGTNQPMPVRLHVDHPPGPLAPDHEEGTDRVVVDALE